DNTDVFKRTVDWGVKNGITTSTYHILTPYPGTNLYKQMENEGRLTTKNWDLFDTRHVVYKTNKLTPEQLQEGYDWAYNEFYKWSNIVKSSAKHDSIKHAMKHFFYTGGWKKFEPVWNFLIKSKNLNNMLPMLEAILSKVNSHNMAEKKPTATSEVVRPLT
ncbi:MAG: B12-binding domain-containing radical SAM protein, partial [Cyclobacteriaceae bacterium]